MSITPLAIEPKCVRNDSEATASITGCGAQLYESIKHVTDYETDPVSRVYEEFYATPAGKDARKMVDYILAIK